MRTKQLLALLIVAVVLGSPAWGQPSDQREVLFVCKHGNVKSLMAASYFNRLATERGPPYRASARGSDVDKPEVPKDVATKLGQEGFDVTAFRAAPASAADLEHAKRIVLIETSLPNAPAAAARKVEQWDDVPPASVDYPAASAALKTHIERLLEQLEK